jgi:putative transposase
MHSQSAALTLGTRETGQESRIRRGAHREALRTRGINALGTHTLLESSFSLRHHPSLRSRYTVREKERAHFITSTIVAWLPVFHRAECRDILVDSLDYCRREKGLRLYAWVIMENHFHAVVHAEAGNLPRVMADLKKFTAGKLLAQLEVEGRSDLLECLASGKAAHKTGSRYQLWQEGYHPQAIYTDETILQKIDYIHANPVRRGWVTSPEHWRYSSAHEWLPGSQPVLRCDPWR